MLGMRIPGLGCRVPARKDSRAQVFRVNSFEGLKEFGADFRPGRVLGPESFEQSGFGGLTGAWALGLMFGMPISGPECCFPARKGSRARVFRAKWVSRSKGMSSGACL